MTSNYLNQWWLDYWRIYASLGLNVLYLVWFLPVVCSMLICGHRDYVVPYDANQVIGTKIYRLVLAGKIDYFMDILIVSFIDDNPLKPYTLLPQWVDWRYKTLCILINPNYGCGVALMHKKWHNNGSGNVYKTPYIMAIASHKPRLWQIECVTIFCGCCDGKILEIMSCLQWWYCPIDTFDWWR